MRQWNNAEREHQAQIIRRVKPWEKSTGPRTIEGKKKSKMNAYVDGAYTTEGKHQSQLIRDCKKRIKLLWRKPKKV